jgi:hypothetical protein
MMRLGVLGPVPLAIGADVIANVAFMGLEIAADHALVAGKALAANGPERVREDVRRQMENISKTKKRSGTLGNRRKSPAIGA